MNCPEIRDLLPLHLYGDLSNGERVAVDAHLGGCPECRAELAALGALRKELDKTPSRLPGVDVAAIYRVESERLRRRARNWRGSAVMAIAASVVLLATRLEFRADGQKLVVRWGATPEVEPPHVVETVVVRHEPAVAPELDERIKTMNTLIQAIVVNMDAKDRDQQQELDRLRKEVTTLQQIRKRLGQTERDVSALYTAQFGSRPSGANP